MKLVVIGLGYVGLSNALLLAQKYPVLATDVDSERVAQLKQKISPFSDTEIEAYLAKDNPNFQVTSDKASAIKGADYIIIATPTNYDDISNCFDTSSVDSVIDEVLQINNDATLIIKSTIPVGYTLQVRERFNYPAIIFSPEFLREGKALYDNLYPSRIVVGAETKAAELFAEMLRSCALSENVEVLLTGSTEAEAIKLFANTYLAMRVAFFNELDTYALTGDLNAAQIVRGVGLDPRIGEHYNNPSFGYGGYCLPKDTKQLLANYEGIPNNIIRAVVESNQTRKQYMAWLLQQKTQADKGYVVGIYRLAMKKDSDNFRSSAIIDIMQMLTERGVTVLLYEPAVDAQEFMGVRIESDLEDFKRKADLIVTNRQDEQLADVADKLFTRDLFGNDF